MFPCRGYIVSCLDCPFYGREVWVWDFVESVWEWVSESETYCCPLGEWKGVQKRESNRHHPSSPENHGAVRGEEERGGEGRGGEGRGGE